MAENNENESKSVSETQKADEDLDSLLDSALDDFKKVEAEKKPEASASSTTIKEEETEQMWTEMVKQALQGDPNIQNMFQQGNSEQNNFVEDFTKIAEAAAKVFEGENAPTNFADIMTETLRNLNESSETIQSQFGNPDELSNLFQELGLSGTAPGATGEELPAFMQSIMQSFLSKDVLYPSMKDFVDKYPGWLEEHKETLTPEQFDNYSQQLALMRRVVAEFDAETESDSDDMKRQRFQRIMDHMQQMQALGHPPAELVSSDGPQLDDLALPPGMMPPGMDPNQCLLM